MSLLLQNVTVRDTRSPYHGQQVSIHIADGKVQSFNQDVKADQVLDLQGIEITPGFFDLWSHFHDPGHEHKEDLNSGMATAQAGGYTDVCLLPDTHPVADNKSQITYWLNKSQFHPVKIHPYAMVSQGGKDEVISEMRDLHENGAVAFTGGLRPIANTELLLKSLQYTSSFGGLVINRPSDIYLTRFGQMHEGFVSTSLGLKGMASIAEKVAIERDLNVLEYAGGRLHLSGISSKEGVETVRKAKERGLPVTCDVSIHHLIYTDESLTTFDSNLKLNPPLRTEEDRQALIEGVRSGVIDAISAEHIPQDTECKELEFDLADFGAISLQTVYSQLLTISDHIPMDILVDKCTYGPRAILGYEMITIAEGSIARFALFDPKAKWTLDHQTNRSKSNNTVLFGQQLTGRSTGIVVGNTYYRNI